MLPDSNRHHAGMPTACPDCGATAATADARSAPADPARIHHEPTCPIRLAALELLGTDLGWFHDHPSESLLLRPVARGEFADLATALGRRVPRSQRRRWEVAVHPYDNGVCRQYACDGCVVAVQIDRPDPAGAL